MRKCKCGNPTEYSRCAPCAAEYGRKWRSENPDRMTELRTRARCKRYGITTDQYDAMWFAQGELCAICSAPEHGGRGWSIDHDHESGRVRGILCHHCNLMLGQAKDSVDTLASAITYLDAERIVL